MSRNKRRPGPKDPIQKKNLIKSIQELIIKGYSVNEIMRELNIGYQLLKDAKDAIPKEKLETIIEHNRIQRRAQKFQDKNRIENKNWRAHARMVNAIEEETKELIKLLNKYDFSKYCKNIKTKNNKYILIIQLSDLHFNELILNSYGVDNDYNYEIASKRLKKLAMNIKIECNNRDITKCLIAFTGDMLNSDRRMDEMMAAACNRSKALFIGVDLLYQFLLDIRSFLNIECVSVVGNESRVKDEMGFTPAVIGDNYDFSLYNMLALTLGKTDIKFHPITDYNMVENYINVNGNNILILHGHTSLGNQRDIEKKVNSLIGKYAQQGVIIHYVIFGHKHSSRMGDNYGRSASLAGSNAYSSYGLGLQGRASQNIYLVSTTDTHGIVIDLQNTDKIKPYKTSLIDKLGIDIYNPKSQEKNRKQQAIIIKS